MDGINARWALAPDDSDLHARLTRATALILDAAAPGPRRKCGAGK
ncbi:hypothetical protein [Nonomuraea sp. SYSU D8015]|nr:hypothetical protein [Nonomuraea sp. SYSU D8015]